MIDPMRELAQLEAEWEAGTLTERRRQRLVAWSGTIR